MKSKLDLNAENNNFFVQKKRWKLKMESYPRKSEKTADEDFEHAEVQGEKAPCQEEDVETAGSSEQKTGHGARPTDYPSVWTKDQYDQFKSKNEWLYIQHGKLKLRV
ncbi:hypothetical protein CHARACLAT_013865 [Characodon lateralis]|uniref:Uncharacterized protein n=1 Tax=Characodon lateralis TaxID=208331 RepID=A0ABU7DQY5_9TELE|nr:hypothetical protein [Characodon lateralis]